MSVSDARKRSLGNELFNLGWQQGTLFSAPSACFMLNRLSDPGSTAQITRSDRPTGPNEKFVLISQDCDIVASDALEPYVEALLCKLEKPRFVSKINSNSTRWFVIDYQTGLVAYARYRTQFEKQVLKKITPEPWPNGPNRLDEFVRWLARRYDRPAIPDALVDAFQKPLEARIANLEEENPDIFAAFNRVVSDVRINIPASEDPPFDLHVTLLVSSDGLSVEELNAIDAFKVAIHSSLDTNLVHLDPDDPRILTEEDMSLKEFYATRPIYLGDYTYRGEEIEGARPPERSS
jgi:hypothetical protein